MVCRMLTHIRSDSFSCQLSCRNFMGELYMTIMTSCNIVYTLLTDTFDTKSPLIDEIGLMIVFINI